MAMSKTVLRDALDPRIKTALDKMKDDTSLDIAGKNAALVTFATDLATLIADEVIDHITGNMVVATTLDTSLNTTFTAGVPVLNDGGAVLQTAWKSATASGARDDATSNSVT